MLDLRPFTGETVLIKQSIETLHVSDDIAEEEIQGAGRAQWRAKQVDSVL